MDTECYSLLRVNGSKTPKEQMLEILDAATAKTWKIDVERERLRKLIPAI